MGGGFPRETHGRVPNRKSKQLSAESQRLRTSMIAAQQPWSGLLAKHLSSTEAETYIATLRSAARLQVSGARSTPLPARLIRSQPDHQAEQRSVQCAGEGKQELSIPLSLLDLTWRPTMLNGTGTMCVSKTDVVKEQPVRKDAESHAADTRATSANSCDY